MAIKVVQLTESAVLTQVVSDGFFVTKYVLYIYFAYDLALNCKSDYTVPAVFASLRVNE